MAEILVAFRSFAYEPPSLTMFKAQTLSYMKCYTRSGPVSVVPRVMSRRGI